MREIPVEMARLTVGVCPQIEQVAQMGWAESVAVTDPTSTGGAICNPFPFQGKGSNGVLLTGC